MRGIEIVQIGSRHAVRDYLRRIDASYAHPIDSPHDWFGQMLAGYRKRMTPAIRDAALSTMTDGPGSASILRLTRSTGRRLGKEIVSIVAMRAHHATIAPVGEGAPADRSDEIVMLWRETYDVGIDRLDMVTGPTHLALTRHALERIHQREGCMTGEIDAKIKEQIVDADRNMAFAAATGLCLGGCDGEIRPGSTLLIPLADSLLIVEARCVVTKDFAVRLVVKKGVVQQRTVEMNANNALTLRDPEGREALVALMHTARTYLTSEILRPEQREYRDLFLELASNEAMKGIEAQFQQAQRADHRTRVRLSFTEHDAVKMARLRELLPLCISPERDLHPLWDIT